MKAELKTAKGPVSLTGEPTGEIKVIIGNSLVVVIHDARMLTHPKLETEQQTCIVVCHAITCLSKKYLLLGFVCLFVCFTTELAKFIFTATELSVAMTHGNKVLSQTCRDSR